MLSGGLSGRAIALRAGTLRLRLGVLRGGRLGRLPRLARVLLGSTGPGLGLGRPGFRAADRSVPLLPRRSHLLLSSPLGLGGPCLRSLFLPLSGCLRRQRLSQLRISLLGTGLKPGPGRLCRRNLRFEPGPQLSLVPRGVLAGLRHLPVRSPARPVQLRAGRLGRLPRLARVLLGSTGPGLGLGRPGFRAADRSVPLLPRRSHLLLSSPLGLGGPCLRSLFLPLSGCLRRQRLSQLRISLLGTGLKPGPGRLCRRNLRFEPGPQLSLVPRGVLAGLRHLPVRSPARPVQLRAGRLGRLPRLARVLLGSTGPGLGLGRPGFRAADRSVPLLPRRSHLLLSSPLGLGGPCLRSLFLPLSGCLRRQRLSQLRISLECGRMRLPRISLSPLAAPPEDEPGAAQILRPSHPATLPGQHLAPPERGQRRMRLPGHRVRQLTVPRLRRRPRIPRPQLVLTAGIRASEVFLSGHRQAPFRSPAQRNRAARSGRKPAHPGNRSSGFSAALTSAVPKYCAFPRTLVIPAHC